MDGGNIFNELMICSRISLFEMSEKWVSLRTRPDKRDKVAVAFGLLNFFLYFSATSYETRNVNCVKINISDVQKSLEALKRLAQQVIGRKFLSHKDTPTGLFTSSRATWNAPRRFFVAVLATSFQRLCKGKQLKEKSRKNAKKANTISKTS